MLQWISRKFSVSVCQGNPYSYAIAEEGFDYKNDQVFSSDL
jgi:hypothetical protein